MDSNAPSHLQTPTPKSTFITSLISILFTFPNLNTLLQNQHFCVGINMIFNKSKKINENCNFCQLNLFSITTEGFLKAGHLKTSHGQIICENLFGFNCQYRLGPIVLIETVLSLQVILNLNKCYIFRRQKKFVIFRHCERWINCCMRH